MTKCQINVKIENDQIFAKSDGCAPDTKIAIYSYEDTGPAQWDPSKSQTLLDHGTTQVSADLACGVDFQIDVFKGEVIVNIPQNMYGPRLVTAKHVDGIECATTTTSTTALTTTTSSVDPPTPPTNPPVVSTTTTSPVVLAPPTSVVVSDPTPAPSTTAPIATTSTTQLIVPGPTLPVTGTSTAVADVGLAVLSFGLVVSAIATRLRLAR